MHYTVLAPPAPTDPREIEFASTEELIATMPAEYATDMELDAATWVFERYPDALVMPVPVKIGSGTSFMLGIIANVSAPRDSDSTIPFVRFVRAAPQIDRERKLVKSHKHWTSAAWRTPVARPTASSSVITPVEIRGTDLDHPAVVNGAMFGKTEDGRSIVRCELNGISVSFTFNDRAVQIVRGEDLHDRA